MKKLVINIIINFIGICVIVFSINVHHFFDNKVIGIVCSYFLIALALMIFYSGKIYIPNCDQFDKTNYLIKVLIYSSIIMALMITSVILIVAY